MSHPYMNGYPCPCIDCEESDHPCFGTCIGDSMCAGCREALEEEEETKHEIDSQIGRI